MRPADLPDCDGRAPSVIATPHMLAGAACATRVRTPAAGLAVGTLTHLLLDALPHRDYQRSALGGTLLAADLSAGTLVVCILGGCTHVTLAGALGGLLPDLLGRAERSLPVRPIGWVHAMVHTDTRPARSRSALIQGAVALLGAVTLAARVREPQRCRRGGVGRCRRGSR